PLGSEIYLYLSTKEGAQMIASVDPHLELKVGDHIEIGIVMKKAHVFESLRGSEESEGSEEKCII
ncbi:MAG: hypothetical protein JXB50_09115, partial [Spirochaetes bacterium]|nr:hypothetical protein [Spirochaetota bacterium]